MLNMNNETSIDNIGYLLFMQNNSKKDEDGENKEHLEREQTTPRRK